MHTKQQAENMTRVVSYNTISKSDDAQLVTNKNGNLVNYIAPRIKPSRGKFLNQPYFWGEEYNKHNPTSFPRHKGYAEARRIIQDGSLQLMWDLTDAALKFLSLVFQDVSDDEDASSVVYSISLSPDLIKWKQEQHQQGYVAPSKGHGIKRASPEVLQLLGAEKWPAPLVINGALWGCGIANMLIGGYDSRTLYSNYCTDMVFYYEHSYHKVFPEFEDLIRREASDTYALATPAGIERRAMVEIGMKYVKNKIDLEFEHKSKLEGKMARMNRKTAQIICYLEGSLVGMAAEAIARNFDAAAVMSDMVFSSPATDVVDVGADYQNSEVMNSFLNTADIADTGVITEEALRRVYNAYSHIGARMLTERWAEPLARMVALLYTWHIQNNRHWFCRRALLGYQKIRKTPSEQREADFDEAFDEDLRTTGFSRPLKNACNGGDPCDAVLNFVKNHKSVELLTHLWSCLATAPQKYASNGIISQQLEDEIEENLSLAMARTYSLGLVEELAWLVAHANHHAWQVSFLFEAAMFGSLLDDGALVGKIDRRSY